MRFERFQAVKMVARWSPLLLLVVFAACASQPPVEDASDVPGFWMGLWHGFIAPIALIGEIFSSHRIYAFPNSGGWYDFGFILGISAWGGGAAAGR
jgi:hypothetical protein